MAGLTQQQQAAQDQLTYEQNRSLDSYNNPDFFGTSASSAAAMMDPYLASVYQGVDDIQNLSDTEKAKIAAHTAAMNQAYQTGGWDAVKQAAKDINVANAQQGVDFMQTHPNGVDQSDGGFMSFMSTALPIAVGAIVGGGVGGLYGGGGTSAATTGLGGSAITDTAGGLGGMSASGPGIAGAGATGAAAGIPTVTVTGSAGGAGLGTAGLAGAGAVGLGAMTGSGGVDPSVQQVHVTGHPDGVPVPESSLPPLVMPPINTSMPPGSVTLPADGKSTDPNTGGLLGGIPVGSVPNPNPNASDMPGGLPGSVPGSGSGSITPSQVVGGLGSLYTGYQDYKMNQADKDYYQGLLNKMMGMYQPGTDEANLMQKQMEAKDAAAGRNSQYGVRAVNLASALAQQRAQMMTSPTFEKIAEASRGHYDSSLASLSSLFGGANTSGTALNSLINTGIDKGSTWLNSLFSNNS